jgi:protein gp37
MINGEWWDAAWNPFIGCTPVSEGCINCWAKSIHNRFEKSHSFDQVLFYGARLREPIDRWKQHKNIFVCNMSDLFHDDICFEDYNKIWFERIFEQLQYCQNNHTYFILTKRPKNIRSAPLEILDSLHNTYFGVSAEKQEMANQRINDLLGVPVINRFASFEPLLGPISLRAVDDYVYGNGQAKINWVIVGCESGPKRRPCKIEWVRDIVNECKEARVPVWVKQLDINGKCEKDLRKFPKNLRIRQYPEGLK